MSDYRQTLSLSCLNRHRRSSATIGRIIVTLLIGFAASWAGFATTNASGQDSNDAAVIDLTRSNRLKSDVNPAVDEGAVAGLQIALNDSKTRSLPAESGLPLEVANQQRRAATNSQGNAERGKQLFASDNLKCAACHKVAGQGGTSGPDLSVVAGKLDRTHLIESLLDPSAQILEGYRTSVVVLKDGRTLTGIVSNEAQDEFVLTDASSKPTKVLNDDVDERLSSRVSLMPGNLTAGLSPAQFTDLIAYLETLHAGRRPNPGEGSTGAVSVPEGFVSHLITDGLSGCTAMDVAPDGRIFVCEQTGALRVIKDGRLLAEPFATLKVTSTWERGLIGVTLHPDFPRTPDLFVCYVAATPDPHHVISRLTADGDRAVPGSEQILFEGDDQTKLGGDKPDGHQGGALHFGTDGKLYVAIAIRRPVHRLSALIRCWESYCG